MLASSRLQTIVWTACISEAEKFYSGVLGLPLKARSHGALVYDVGGADLRVSPVPSTQPSAHTVVGFAVPDLRIVMSELIERGIRLERIAGMPLDPSGVLVTPEGVRKWHGCGTQTAIYYPSCNMPAQRLLRVFPPEESRSPWTSGSRRWVSRWLHR